VRAEPGLVGACRDGVPAARVAAYVGHPELGTLLVALGAHLDVFDAAALGDVDRLRELLDADGSLATAVAADGFTALHLSAWFGHPRVAELLLARGADPEHSAAHRNDEAMVALLLDRGADPSAATDDGRTPRDLATDPAVLALLP
jgi:ankyrin repeat protein